MLIAAQGSTERAHFRAMIAKLVSETHTQKEATIILDLLFRNGPMWSLFCTAYTRGTASAWSRALSQHVTLSLLRRECPFPLTTDLMTSTIMHSLEALAPAKTKEVCRGLHALGRRLNLLDNPLREDVSRLMAKQLRKRAKKKALPFHSTDAVYAVVRKHPRLHIILYLMVQCAARWSDIAQCCKRSFNLRRTSLRVNLLTTKSQQVASTLRHDHVMTVHLPRYFHPQFRALVDTGWEIDHLKAGMRKALKSVSVPPSWITLCATHRAPNLVRRHYTLHSAKATRLKQVWETPGVSPHEIMTAGRHTTMAAAIEYCPRMDLIPVIMRNPLNTLST